MDNLAALGDGFLVALMPVNLFYCFVGVLLGTVIGVIPGIGSLAAVSMLLPISFYLEPTTALIMLAGIYYGAQYGGSITAILVNLPGESASVVTAFDGNPLAKQGKAGIALFLTTAGSFIGGLTGVILMIALAPVLSRLAIAFGPAEYFAVMLLGLVAAVTISSGSLVKGFISIILGLMLGVVGADPSTASQRFTFGFLQLAEGVPLEAIAMGLFGVSEVLASIRTTVGVPRIALVRLSDMFPSRQQWREALPAMFRGSGIGSFFGALPGAGVTIASFVAYSSEKKLSRHPETFGKGAIAGVSAPEAANNAAVQTAFIPTLTLGVPGSASMAVMLGALMIHNVLPGPAMITQHGDVFWGLVASFVMGNIILVILNVPMINIWVRMLRIPYEYLYPMILLFICIGVFSVRNSLFDVGVVLVAGIVGYGMRLLRYEPAPLLMAFVLGPQIEENLRRALTLSRGSLWVFLTSPVSMVILLVATGLLLWSIVGAFKGTRTAYAEEDG